MKKTDAKESQKHSAAEILHRINDGGGIKVFPRYFVILMFPSDCKVIASRQFKIQLIMTRAFKIFSSG